MTSEGVGRLPRAAWASAVRQRRRDLRLTQLELADLAEVGVRLVHEVERGKQTVTVANLVKLLNALGLHLELAPGSSRTVDVAERLQSGRVES